MEDRRRGTPVNASGGTVPDDPDVTFVSPRFDEKSVQRVRAAGPRAVPGRVPARRRFNMAAVCLVAALAGAAAGAAALMFYQRDAREAPNSDTRPAALVDATRPSDEAGTPAEAGRQVDDPAAAGVASVPRSEAAGEPAAAEASDVTAPERGGTRGDEEAALRGALGAWVAATNARDIGRQMSFYGERVGAFYLARDATREAVRAEKSRVFAAANAVEVSAGEPDIRLSPDARNATMRFRKKYSIEGGGRERRGEVLQELRWRRTEGGWKIVGERDLRVIQ